MVSGFNLSCSTLDIKSVYSAAVQGFSSPSSHITSAASTAGIGLTVSDLLHDHIVRAPLDKEGAMGIC